MQLPGYVDPGMGLGIAGGTGVFPGLQLFVTRVQLLPFQLHVHVFSEGVPPELELDAMTFPLKRDVEKLGFLVIQGGVVPDMVET